MQGRAYIHLAADILAGNTEAHRPGAAGRAYYGLMLECRDVLFRWGFKLPPRDSVHHFVRLRFLRKAVEIFESFGNKFLTRSGRTFFDVVVQLENERIGKTAHIVKPAFGASLRDLRFLILPKSDDKTAG